MIVDNVSPKHNAPLAVILDHVAAEFRIPTGALKGRTRSRFIARPRQVFYWLAGQAGHGIAETGRYVNRDHSTVLYAAAITDLRMEKDAQLAEKLRGLASRLRIETFHRPQLGKVSRQNLGEGME